MTNKCSIKGGARGPPAGRVLVGASKHTICLARSGVKLAQEGSPRTQQVADLVMAQLIKSSAAPYQQVPAPCHQSHEAHTCRIAHGRRA